MVWTTPSIKDASIYEYDPFRNTGLDQLLDVSIFKENDNKYESRALIKFNVSEISDVLSDSSIDTDSINAKIRLYVSQLDGLPEEFTLVCRPIAADWVNGSGYYFFPSGRVTSGSTTIGVTWNSVAGTNSETWQSVLVSGSSVSGSYNTVEGGGVWKTTNESTETIARNKTNRIDFIEIDVTEEVSDWINNNTDNYGFIVSLRDDNQIYDVSSTELKFHSKETDTVFEPFLSVAWESHISTGSLDTNIIPAINKKEQPVVYTQGLNSTVQIDSLNRIYLGARPRFPRKQFSQNTHFAASMSFPDESYYRLLDAHTNTVLVDYSDYTKLSREGSSWYFDFYSTMMYPERYYMFEIKTVNPDGISYFKSPDFIFKAVI